MASKYLCNLIIPGAGKSGTSSLHEILNQHPGVCMSSPKEPQFFSFSNRYIQGSDLHNSFFKGGEQSVYFGESSQCYFAHDHAIERIAGSLDKPKIIISLRDPIKRLLSQYAWNYRRGTETEELGRALKERGETVDYTYDKRIGSYREVGGYIAFSRYSLWVPTWQQAFGNENVLVINFENFVNAPDRVLKECFDFLNVDADLSLSVAQRNATKATFTKVYPMYISAVGKIIPDILKRNLWYEKLKMNLRRYLTSKPDVNMSAGLEAQLNNTLRDDIKFYSSFR